MNQVGIDCSDKQLKRLRKGHRVRVRCGSGFNLVVKPGTYSQMTKSFSKGRAIDIALDGEEINANQHFTTALDNSMGEHQMARGEQMMEGQGIFGRQFDRELGKRIGKRNRKELYNLARDYRIPAKTAIQAGIMSGAAGLSAIAPEFIPFIAPASLAAASYAGDYLDNPSLYQTKPDVKKLKGIAVNRAQAEVNNRINRELGTNYDYMNRAGLEKAFSDQASAMLDSKAFQLKESAAYQTVQPRQFQTVTPPSRFQGYGLGAGLYGRGVAPVYRPAVMCKERLQQPTHIMGRGVRIGERQTFDSTPALQSQPGGCNYQFNHTLYIPGGPLERGGNGLYAGAYRGHGLQL